MDHLPHDVSLFNQFHALIVYTGKTFCRKMPKCERLPAADAASGKDAPSEAQMSSPLHLTDYAGVIHLHSAYSFDGRAPIAEILAAANESGIDFLLLTDHGTLQARSDGWEGWHDGTLLIVGEEIAPRFNHLLAFQLPESIMPAEDPPDACPAGLSRPRPGRRRDRLHRPPGP